MAVHAPAPPTAVTLTVGSPGAPTVLPAYTRWPSGAIIDLIGSVIVPSEGELSIGAGVVVQATMNTEIVVGRDARLDVQGTALQPVIFTCSGGQRQPGCWGGLTILGNAPLNHGVLDSPSGIRGGAGNCRQAQLDPWRYGGCEATDSSGVLRYARIQYATSGLRVFGVGSGTVMEFLQVHRSLGNGVEVDGGTASFRQLALTTNAQHGLSFRGGWTGQAQYVVVQQDPIAYAGGIHGVNAKGLTDDHDALPRSAPTLANVTVIAPPGAANPYAGSHPAALRLQRGAAGAFYNVLLVDPDIALDVDDDATCQQVTTASLSLSGVALIAPVAATDPDSDPATCASGGEVGLLSQATVISGPDAASQLIAARNIVLPDLRPTTQSLLAATRGTAPPSNGFFDPVTFVGAVPPANTRHSDIPWYSGWTIGEQLAAPMLVTLTGNVSGTNDRGRLAGITVQVDPFAATATTDATGHFALPGVPAGPLTVSIIGGLPAGCTAPAPVTYSLVSNGSVELNAPCNGSLPTSSALAAGQNHTCAIAAGEIYCAGDNSSGQLGDGTTAERWVPVRVLAPTGVRFVEVSAGTSHSCGLGEDGAIYCWGDNREGQLGDHSLTSHARPAAVVSQRGMRFLQVVSGHDHSCGLSQAGTAFCWGDNSLGQLGDGSSTDRLAPVRVLVPPGVTFLRLATGLARHSCGVTPQGTAYCWGFNSGGQLGDGTLITRVTPVTVAAPPGVTFVDIATPGNRSCGLTRGGTAYCWGSPPLGDGTFTQASTPTPVSIPPGGSFSRVSGAGGSVCVVARAGLASCWGDNTLGTVGDGTNDYRLSPVLVSVPTGITFSEIAVSGHACGVSTGRTVYCWGYNGHGQFGDGTRFGSSSPPVVVQAPPGISFASLSAGFSSPCAVTLSGAAFCWGSDSTFQLGNGAPSQDSKVPAPVQLPSGTSLASVAAGVNHSCAVSTAGTILCWGSNSFGQLGDGTTTWRATPVPIAGPPGVSFVAVSVYRSHSCALSAFGGPVYCWGQNWAGQLGDGTTMDHLLPTPVAAPIGVTFLSVSTGDSHTCSIGTNGSTYCWGYNASSQIGDGTATNRATPTQVALPPGVSLSRLSAGDQHTCGVTFGGQSWCWGDNSHGALGDGTRATPTTPVAVAAPRGVLFSDVDSGVGHTCAIAFLGRAYCWGDNVENQLGIGAGATSLVPAPVLAPQGITLIWVSAGFRHTCAIAVSGASYCWGSNRTGQLGNGYDWRVPRPTLFP